MDTELQPTTILRFVYGGVQGAGCRSFRSFSDEFDSAWKFLNAPLGNAVGATA